MGLMLYFDIVLVDNWGQKEYKSQGIDEYKEKYVLWTQNSSYIYKLTEIVKVFMRYVQVHYKPTLAFKEELGKKSQL